MSNHHLGRFIKALRDHTPDSDELSNDELLKYWKPTDVYREKDNHCLCGQSITVCCVIEHTHTAETLIVGCVCIAKFGSDYHTDVFESVSKQQIAKHKNSKIAVKCINCYGKSRCKCNKLKYLKCRYCDQIVSNEGDNFEQHFQNEHVKPHMEKQPKTTFKIRRTEPVQSSPGSFKFTCTKYKELTIDEVYERDPSFLKWFDNQIKTGKAFGNKKMLDAVTQFMATH